MNGNLNVIGNQDVLGKMDIQNNLNVEGLLSYKKEWLSASGGNVGNIICSGNKIDKFFCLNKVKGTTPFVDAFVKSEGSAKEQEGKGYFKVPKDGFYQFIFTILVEPIIVKSDVSQDRLTLELPGSYNQILEISRPGEPEKTFFRSSWHTILSPPENPSTPPPDSCDVKDVRPRTVGTNYPKYFSFTVFLSLKKDDEVRPQMYSEFDVKDFTPANNRNIFNTAALVIPTLDVCLLTAKPHIPDVEKEIDIEESLQDKVGVHFSSSFL